jgi:hypothetical protein
LRTEEQKTCTRIRGLPDLLRVNEKHNRLPNGKNLGEWASNGRSNEGCEKADSLTCLKELPSALTYFCAREDNILRINLPRGGLWPPRRRLQARGQPTTDFKAKQSDDADREAGRRQDHLLGPSSVAKA